MIFDYFPTGDKPKLYTRVLFRDKYLLIGLSEEALFRSVMGDREFDRAVEDEYSRAVKVERAEAALKAKEPLKPKKWWQL